MEALVKLKKLGLVGGMGPESTIPYYRDIVYGVQKRVGEQFFPNLTIESVNVFDVLEYCRMENYEGLIIYLLRAIRNLAASGADFAALTANTPHIVFEQLQQRSPISLVSIVEATAQEADRLHMQKVGLLGTIFTMNGDFFRKPFIKNGIEIITTTCAEKEYIDNKIAKELELGIVKEETLKSFIQVIERMKSDSHIQAVILGCTELPLLFNGTATPVACLDTMKIHVNKLIDIIVDNYIKD